MLTRKKTNEDDQKFEKAYEYAISNLEYPNSYDFYQPEISSEFAPETSSESAPNDTLDHHYLCSTTIKRASHQATHEIKESKPTRLKNFFHFQIFSSKSPKEKVLSSEGESNLKSKNYLMIDY